MESVEAWVRSERTSRRSGDRLEAGENGEDGEAERDEQGDAREVSGASEERMKDSEVDGLVDDVPKPEDFFEGEESVREERAKDMRFVGDEGPPVLSSSSSLARWRAPSSG